MKRKLPSSKQEPDLVKKQRLSGKSQKSKESVFATLCSTLSQAVLPSKKTTNAPNPQDTNVGPTNDKTRQDTSPNEEKESDKSDEAVASKLAINGS